MYIREVDQFFLDLTQKAQRIHKEERKITFESIRLVGELDHRKVWHIMGLSVEKFAQYIGLTPSTYWKRLAAHDVMARHPYARELFEAGEVEVSHLVIIKGCITEANSDVLLNGIKGQSKRDAESFISRVTNTGAIRDCEGFTELTIRLKDSEREIFERAREVLAHGGHVPSNAEIILQASRDLLEKRDPEKKAERAMARAEKKSRPRASDEASDEPSFEMTSREEDEEIAERDLEPSLNSPSPGQRKAIAASVRQKVWRRNQGRCTFVHGNGDRCSARMMLEYDHVIMICRGGENDFSNLRLRCRFHNRHTAEVELGRSLYPCPGEVG